MEQTKLIQIAPEDNVAVATVPLATGETVDLNGQVLTVIQDIPFGHKIALCDLPEGDNIIKYGHPIGHAKADIKAGEHVHTHNIATNLGELLDYSYDRNDAVIDSFDLTRPENRQEASFEGYLREDGRAGIRNEIWIVPTVGCVNKTAEKLAALADAKFGDRTDGIHAFTHNMGCSQLTEDMERTQKLLAGIINNPNAGAVLVLSLGCENNNLDVFKPFLGDYNPECIRFLVSQDTEDEMEAGMEILSELSDYASQFKRQTLDAGKLTIGFKCGGSDAFSGITANALCGRVNDRLVRCGGTTLLTEVPEMFGAETGLMNRAVNEEVFQKEVGLINGFKQYFTRYGQTIYENPSPGNKKGGISTLEDKSSGCVQKGGQAPVVDVLDYGEPAVKNGLNLLTGPGNDQVSCTGLTASGAVMILFTTGRGNPFGAPVPTLKIASNTPLYKKKTNWVDFNAGVVLDGTDMETAAGSLFQCVLDTASGKAAKNETSGYREISVFRDGVIL
ncbi:MAG: UxaA family hydrolase [Eubacteriaceae bacterium]|jgi:altronate hydrolase